MRLALPKEFTLEQNINLLKEYVHENFVSRGMVADFAIHDKKDDNPHAHVLLTMRPIKPDGKFGAKSRMEYILDDDGERIKLPSGRYKTKKITTTDWDDRANAEIWRKNWADTLNKYLDYHKLEQRVDHRSYERQGLEELPTIHLGAVAHALEQKGIKTERGNINRAVKKKNARLREINADMRTIKAEQDELRKQQAPQFIIDVKNSIKAQNSVGYANWASLFNLQQMAQTLIYIEKNGYTDLQSMQQAYANAVNDYTEVSGELNITRERINRAKTLRNVATTYRQTADIYAKYNAPNVTADFKEQFYQNHKAEIEKHKSARAYIYGELELTKFPNLKNLSEEIKELADYEEDLTAEHTIARDSLKKLDIVHHNASMLLGYKDLEERNIDVVRNLINATGFERYANVPIYKNTFAEADARGYRERALYLQNRFLNRDCAEYLMESANGSINKNATNNEVIDYAIEIYGLERVEWVLAITVINEMKSNSDRLSEFTGWALLKDLPNEPDDTTGLEDEGNSSIWLADAIKAVQLKTDKHSHKIEHFEEEHDEEHRVEGKYDNEEHGNEEKLDGRVKNPHFKDGSYADFSHLNPYKSEPYTQPQTQQKAVPATQRLMQPPKTTPLVEVPQNKPKKKSRGMNR